MRKSKLGFFLVNKLSANIDELKPSTKLSFQSEFKRITKRSRCSSKTQKSMFCSLQNSQRIIRSAMMQDDDGINNLLTEFKHNLINGLPHFSTHFRHRISHRYLSAAFQRISPIPPCLSIHSLHPQYFS